MKETMNRAILMALLIAPLFTAGIAVVGIPNANAGTIGDSNPPAYRGADNSIHFEWTGNFSHI